MIRSATPLSQQQNAHSKNDARKNPLTHAASFVQSVLLKAGMVRSRFFIIRLLFGAAIFAAPIRAVSSDSLFDSSNAQPVATSGIYYDQRMIRAAEMALQRAHAQPTWRCWHYVKDALVGAGVVASRPVSSWAKQAGDELCSRYGFTKLKVKNPYDAPVGAVIVYGGFDAGHVELRTPNGFVSDFISSTPYPRPLVGVFVKPS
jgi:hypothetical protein